MIRLDADSHIAIYSPVCALCRHVSQDPMNPRTCAAFPKEIPLEIWNGDNPHAEPYPGDNGIQFAPREPTP